MVKSKTSHYSGPKDPICKDAFYILTHGTNELLILNYLRLRFKLIKLSQSFSYLLSNFKFLSLNFGSHRTVYLLRDHTRNFHNANKH